MRVDVFLARVQYQKNIRPSYIDKGNREAQLA